MRIEIPAGEGHVALQAPCPDRGGLSFRLAIDPHNEGWEVACVGVTGEEAAAILNTLTDIAYSTGSAQCVTATLPAGEGVFTVERIDDNTAYLTVALPDDSDDTGFFAVSVVATNRQMAVIVDSLSHLSHSAAVLRADHTAR